MADCGIVEASIPLAVFDQVMDSFTGATKSSETKIIGQALNDLGAAATANLPADDKETGKKGFFRQLIKTSTSDTCQDVSKSRCCFSYGNS